MVFRQGLIAASLFGANSLVAAAEKQNALSMFEPGTKWEICIHQPIKHDSPDDFVPQSAPVWDIDMSHAKDYPNMIPMLKEAGKAVICYFNAGAVQSWDDDNSDFPESVRGKTLGGPYTDEWYIDVRDATVLKLMKARLDSAVELGCDAVDPDNIDAWASDGTDPTGFSLKPEDFTKYLTELAEYAHSIQTKNGAPLQIGQKNAPDLAPDLVKVLDFAVLESCMEWEFCGEFQPYISAGKPVYQIEYPASIENEGKLSDADRQRFCERQANDDGFSKILKRASETLDGWGQYCGEESFETPMIKE